jgi:deazaflavin-dependent oxidoreductase (nitroreductase family)
MPDRVGSTARAPGHVLFFGQFLKLLLEIGVPLGFNRLITIRGRKSGLPHTTPLAVIEVKGRRWIWAPWGEVQWVRNLRTAGRATISLRHQSEEVSATELDPAQRVEFFRDVLSPLAKSIPFGMWFFRIADGVDLNHPEEVAKDRRVFELKPLQ